MTAWLLRARRKVDWYDPLLGSQDEWLKGTSPDKIMKDDTNKSAKTHGLIKIVSCAKREDEWPLKPWKFQTVQKEGSRLIERERVHYNLDVIIAVGYRVNSKQGTKFRQWATQRLKDLLERGYVVNEARLRQKQQHIQTLQEGIRILCRSIEQSENQNDLNWLATFAKGLTLLDDYDHEQLDRKGRTVREAIYPDLAEYHVVVDAMKADFDSAVFGREKDGSFQSAVAQISKGLGDQDFYPSIEEKAATLLYLIIKNHSFVDGNKRIAAACFLLFLDRNNLLTSGNGVPIISNEALAQPYIVLSGEQARGNGDSEESGRKCFEQEPMTVLLPHSCS